MTQTAQNTPDNVPEGQCETDTPLENSPFQQELAMDYRLGQSDSRFPLGDWMAGSVRELYHSVFKSTPSLQNDQTFERVANLLLDPKMNFDSFRTGMNEILVEKGLPPVNFLKMDEQTSNPKPAACNNKRAALTVLGSYYLGSGTFRMPESLIKSGNLFKVGNVALHEINHFEQDVLITRAIMDDVAKLGPGNFYRDVSARYKSMVGVEPSAGFLRDVEKARDGRELSSAERSRAEILMQSVIDRRIDGPTEMFAGADKNYFQNLRCMLANSLDPSSTMKISPGELIQKMISTAESMQYSNESKVQRDARLFFADGRRTDEAAAQERIKNIKLYFGDPNASNFDELAARLKLNDFFDNRLIQLQHSVSAGHQIYKGHFHESESFEVGNSFTDFLRRKTFKN